MLCRRAIAVNNLGVKLIGERYVFSHPCRRPMFMRTYGSMPVRCMSTAPDGARSQAAAAGAAADPGALADASARKPPGSKLHLVLGDVTSTLQPAKPMLGPPIVPKFMNTKPRASTRSLEAPSVVEYASKRLAKFEDQPIPDVALAMMQMTIQDLIAVLHDLVITCHTSTNALRKKEEDPEVERVHLEHQFENRLSSLIEIEGFRNLLNILRYESANASNADLISALSALSNFSSEQAVLALKPVVEHLAKPLKIAMGHLTPHELGILFHAFAVFQVSDPAAWREATSQINNRFNLFALDTLVNLLVSLTKAPYLADHMSFFLVKLTVRLQPLVSDMSPESLVMLLRTYKIVSTSDRKGFNWLNFRQVIFAEIHTKFDQLSHSMVYDVVASAVQMSETSSSLGKCVDAYLVKRYHRWSQTSLLFFLKYIYAAEVTPSSVVVDSLSIKIFEYLKESSPAGCLESASFLADHGMLPRSLALAMCKSLADKPARLHQVSLPHLVKLLRLVKEAGYHPLEEVLPDFLRANFADMGFDQQTLACEAILALQLFDAELFKVIVKAVMPLLNECPMSLKAAAFCLMRCAQTAGMPVASDEIVNRLATVLCMTNLQPEVGEKVLIAFQDAHTDFPLTSKMRQLRQTLGLSALNHAMSTKVYDNFVIRYLRFAITALAQGRGSFDAGEEEIYKDLLQYVLKGPVSNMVSPDTSEDQYFRLTQAIASSVEWDDARAVESPEHKAALALLHCPPANRAYWISAVGVEQFPGLLAVLTKALKHHPVDLHMWVLPLSAHAVQLMPKMKSGMAIDVLRLFAQMGTVQVQVLGAFASQFRFSLFVFSGPELLTVMQCFTKAAHAPGQLLPQCLEYLLMRLSEFPADQLGEVIVVASHMGSNCHPLLHACEDLILRDGAQHPYADVLQFCRSYSAAGYRSPRMLQLMCDLFLPAIQEGTPGEKLSNGGNALLITALSFPLTPQIHEALQACLLDEEVKEVATSTSQSHHKYAAGALALCQDGVFNNAILAHVFDSAALQTLFSSSRAIGGGQAPANIPEHVLDAYRGLYDVVRAHPDVAVTVDEELAEDCGFADHSLKEHDLLASGILEEDTFSVNAHGHVWPIHLADAATARRTALDLAEGVYRRLIPTPFGIIHMLLVRDANGQLVELPALNPELSVPEWRKELQDKCPALADPNATVYALFCQAAMDRRGGALGRSQLWLRLLEANKIYPLAFSPSAFNQLFDADKDVFVTKLLGPDFDPKTFPLCTPRHTASALA